jgi:hypothetical protein
MATGARDHHRHGDGPKEEPARGLMGAIGGALGQLQMPVLGLSALYNP